MNFGYIGSVQKNVGLCFLYKCNIGLGLSKPITNEYMKVHKRTKNSKKEDSRNKSLRQVLLSFRLFRCLHGELLRGSIKIVSEVVPLTFPSNLL